MAGLEDLRGRALALAERINALQLRERVLLLGAALLVTSYLWDKLYLQPLDARRQAALAQVQSASESLRRVEAAAEEWVAAASIDPDAAARAHLAELGEQLKATRSSVEAKAGRMVAPEQMPEILKTVLSRFRELEFVSLEGLKVEQVALAPPGGAAASAAGEAQSPDKPYGVYRHGIRIRFRGSFPATVEYLHALERLPVGFYWDTVELRTGESPEVEGALVVFTVSLGPGWIGV